MFQAGQLYSRRDFLRNLGYGVGSAAMLSTAEMLCRTSALAGGGPGYKALVCIFMFGGNDSNNMVIPNNVNLGAGGAGYTRYSAAGNRTVASGINITQAQLANTLLNPAGMAAGAFALHPSFGNFNLGSVTGMPGVATRFNQGRAAVVKNVGSLIQPMRGLGAQANATLRQVYLNPGTYGVQRPAQLFSHSDQQNQYASGIANTGTPSSGWGGRLAEKTLAFNITGGNATGLRFPMITSIAGTQLFGIAQQNVNVRQLAAPAHPTQLNQLLVLNGYGATFDEQTRRAVFDYLRSVDQGHAHINAYSRIMDTAVQVATTLGSVGNINVNPEDVSTTGTNGPTPFAASGLNPGTNLNEGLSNQMAQIAKLIVANKTQTSLQLNRQIFFASIGGFDNHSGQGGAAGTQANLLAQVNRAMSALYNWTTNARYRINNGPLQTLGDISGEVTIFTLSDFARTFNPNGNVGTDHAWGSDQLVLGGSVNGARFSGIAQPGSAGGTGQVYQDYLKSGDAPAGTYDSGNRGQWIPTVGTDIYANTLANWFTLNQANGDRDYVFPHIGIKINNYGQPGVLDFML